MQNQRKVKLINDNIYNHIECNNFESLFLQTKIVNRLLFVTQNALAYFSYPSINTKRYIHSLGTMHMVSHLFQYSISNADKEVKEELLSQLAHEIERIIKENNLNIDLGEFDLEDNILYGFSTPLRSKKYFNVYMIILQSLRLTALLHDVGHLPFSHQCEYALEEVRFQLGQDIDTLNENENKFVEKYDHLTNNGTKALHEKIGEDLLEKLFLNEVKEIGKEDGFVQNDYIELMHILVKNTYEEDNMHFNYKVLHKYVSGTIDADRLDYINRDAIASGYLTGPQDTIKLAKSAIIVKRDGEYYLSFLNNSITDIETTLTNRFNLYKKIIYSSDIVRYDSLLEEVIVYVIKKNLQNNYKTETLYKSISMLWSFMDKESKIIESVSQLDENWLITILKKEYFRLKNVKNKNREEEKLTKSFEVILFGRDYYTSIWSNLNEFFDYLNWQEKEKKDFYSKMSKKTSKQKHYLMQKLREFVERMEEKYPDIYLIYSLVDFSIGISESFSVTDGQKLVRLNKVSTIKERLTRSKVNTVPFFLHIVKNENFKEEDFKKELSSFIKKDFFK